MQAFIEGTFAKLGKVLPRGAQLHSEHLIVKDDQGWSSCIRRRLPETACASTIAIAGYCISNGLTVRVRAYLDSAMAARLFEENPIDSK
jgi:uncharacterized protein